MGLIMYDKDMIIKIVILLALAIVAILIYNYWTTGKFFFAPPTENAIPEVAQKEDFFKNITKKTEDEKKVPTVNPAIQQKRASEPEKEPESEPESEPLEHDHPNSPEVMPQLEEIPETEEEIKIF